MARNANHALATVTATAASALLAGGCGCGGDGGTAGSGRDEVRAPAPWPMPNPPAAGLPNPASYRYDAPGGPASGVVADGVTGLWWQREPAAGSLVWSDARAACEALELGGRHDWRLPSLVELVSLVDFTRADPAIDVAAFPDTAADSFWTSTPVAAPAGAVPSGEAWYVGFTTGFSYQGHAALLALRARCVSDGAGAAAPGPGELVWERDQSAPLPWADAAARCRARGAGWRLPSMKELQILVDATRADPAVDPALFPGASANASWSSSALAGSPAEAWTVDFFLGAAVTADGGMALRSRCVR